MPEYARIRDPNLTMQMIDISLLFVGSWASVATSQFPRIVRPACTDMHKISYAAEPPLAKTDQNSQDPGQR
jgi:hypothetical protein